MRVLIEVEVRRLLARRLSRAFVALALMAVAVAGTVVFFKSDNSAGSFARARLEREAEIQECIQFRNSGQEPLPPGVNTAEAACRSPEFGVPVKDPRWHLADLTDVLKGTSPFFIIFAWVLGASFIGADWQKGTIGTTLTWEPRRLRLLGAKLVACVAVCFAGVLALQALLSSSLVPAATFRGTAAGVDLAWLGDLVEIALRVAMLSAIAAAMGFAIAAVGRNTAASFGAGFAYLAIVENLVRGLRPEWVRWLIGDNAALFVAGDRREAIFAGRTVIEAGLLLTLYAGLLVFAAAVSFRHRDVG